MDAWQRPDQIEIRQVKGPDMHVHSTRYTHAMYPENLTWYGRVESSVSFVEQGTVELVYTIKIAEIEYVENVNIVVRTDAEQMGEFLNRFSLILKLNLNPFNTLLLLCFVGNLLEGVVLCFCE